MVPYQHPKDTGSRIKVVKIIKAKQQVAKERIISTEKGPKVIDHQVKASARA